MKLTLTLIKLSSILIILELTGGISTEPTGANPQFKTDNGNITKAISCLDKFF